VKLVLASSSPRRKQLLTDAGYEFVVVLPHADEDAPPALAPEAHAKLLARRKARSVAQGLHEGIVLGADTVVALGDEIIGKPRDAAHAIEILSRLSGTQHACITGLCLIDTSAGVELCESASTTIHMRIVPRPEIEAYVATGECFGKAGAYAIQESADAFIEGIHGSFSNVVGLPLELLAQMLASLQDRGDTRS